MRRTRRARSYPRPARAFVASLLLWLGILIAVLFVSAVGALFKTGDKVYGFCALAALAAFVIVRLLVFVLTRTLVCPLCLGTVLDEKHCQKHGSVRRLPLLTHRTSTATSILLRWAFRCMYCGTDYRLKK